MKQIEEMARINCQLAKYTKISCKECTLTKPCKWFKEAEALYNAGYKQPINDDEVVISKEELIKKYQQEHNWACKETARDILQKVDNESNGQTVAITNSIRKQYGVEVK